MWVNTRKHIRTNSLPHNLDFNEPEKESIVGKVENAGDQHFILFPQCFLPVQRHILIE